VDLSIELQILAFHAQRRSAARSVPEAAVNGVHPRPPVTTELAAQAKA
jgi:hypothetical protein